MREPSEEPIEQPAEGRIKRYVRKHRRKLLIVFLLHVLIGTSIAGVQYLGSRKLPADLPGIVAELGITQPHFVFAIDDVTKPAGVAVSPDAARVFVTESSGPRMVHIFDYSGERVGAFAPPGTAPATRNPAGIAVSKFNEVFVVDTYQHAVLVFSTDGEFLRRFEPDGDPLYEWTPVALSFDRDGNLYVVDQQYPRHQVLVFDKEGNLKLKFGYFGIGDGMFSYPTDVLVDDGGNIYVADSTNVRLQVFDPEGNYLRTLVTGFSLPRGLGFDRGGRLHVVDSLAHQILVLSIDGGELSTEYAYGEQGLDRGQFYFPTDLALDGAGRIYVTDQFSNRVQVWSY